MKLPLGVALTIGGWLLPTSPTEVYVFSLIAMAIGGFLVGSWAADHK